MRSLASRTLFTDRLFVLLEKHTANRLLMAKSNDLILLALKLSLQLLIVAGRLE